MLKVNKEKLLNTKLNEFGTAPFDDDGNPCVKCAFIASLVDSDTKSIPEIRKLYWELVGYVYESLEYRGAKWLDSEPKLVEVLDNYEDQLIREGSEGMIQSLVEALDGLVEFV